MTTKPNSSQIRYDNGTVKDVLDGLTGPTGSVSVGYTPAGAGAVATTVQSKLRESVSIKDFGAVGDGVADDSQAVRDAIAHLFATNGNTLFFPDGIYYFATPVTVTFPAQSYNRGLRLLGTSMPGFTSARPGGSRITGASGIEALFIFTKTAPASAGGYAFECENIDFNGSNRTIGSAIVNKMGGAPMRPFNVYSSNFREFKKAIYSDISATGLTTGICQVNIEGCNFQGNDYALYGKGQNAIMDLRFVGNVCEQNVLGGIHTEGGALGGSYDISDNLLEDQKNAIVLGAGLAKGSIKRNYFESNSEILIHVEPLNRTESYCEIGPNYILNSSGASVYVYGHVNCVDNFSRNGITFEAQGSVISKINNAAILNPKNWTTGLACSFDIASAQVGNNVAPATIDSGSFINFSSGYEDTPLGFVNYNNGSYDLPSTAATLSDGDAIVAVCLARVVSGSPSVALYVYSSSSTYLANTHSVSQPGGLVENGKWFLLAATIKVPSTSTGGARVRWVPSGGVMNFTKTYTYKIAAPTDNSTPLYLYLPYAGPLYGSATYNPPSLVDGAGDTATLNIAGAALGDFVDAVSFSNDLQGITVTGWVSAADTVSVRFQNETGGPIDLASGTLRVSVKKV